MADAKKSIVVENVSKAYGDFWALNDISFSVEPGEIVGFLGPNGAGKTTTMKILTCFMAATKGSAQVAGFDVYDESEEVRRRIGYLPENVPLYEEMMVFDYLNFICEIRGVPKGERLDRIRTVVRLTGLEPVIERDIIELSKGYRQRVGLAQAIIHQPDVIILDEPTSGLDPNQIIEIRDLIKEIGQEKTVIFSTHILQEVAAVCDRIIVIHQGGLIADGPLDELAASVAEEHRGVTVTVHSSDASAVQPMLEAIGGVRRVAKSSSVSDHVKFLVETSDPEAARRAIARLVADGELNLLELTEYQPSLEDVFHALTGGETHESSSGGKPGGSTAKAPRPPESYAPPEAEVEASEAEASEAEGSEAEGSEAEASEAEASEAEESEAEESEAEASEVEASEAEDEQKEDS